MAREAPPDRFRITSRTWHDWTRHSIHSPAHDVSRQLSFCAAIPASRGAAHWERFRDGGWRDLHGIVDAARWVFKVVQQLMGWTFTFQFQLETGWASAYTIEAILMQFTASLVKGQGRICRKAKVSRDFNRKSAEDAFRSLVKTHDKYGWITPALAEGWNWVGVEMWDKRTEIFWIAEM